MCIFWLERYQQQPAGALPAAAMAPKVPKVVPPPKFVPPAPKAPPEVMTALEQAMTQLPLCPRFQRGKCKFAGSCKMSHGDIPTKGSRTYMKGLTGDMRGALEGLPHCSVSGESQSRFQSSLSLRAPLTEAVAAYIEAEHGGRLYNVIRFFTAAHSSN